MPVELTPEAFLLVRFERPALLTLIEQLARQLGLDPSLSLRVEVDESTPLSRAMVTGMNPPTLWIQSGALENTKAPRTLSPSGAADTIGRLLFRVRDRLDPGFGEPPADADLPARHGVAWDVYAVGRLARLGYRHNEPRGRRRYHFRTRHGFTDEADAAFERLWSSERLSWRDIVALSDGAAVALA